MKYWFVYVLLIASLCSAQGNDFAELSAKAAAARNANDSAGAISLYQQALQLNPAWQEGWWAAGSLAYDAERYADCVASLEHLVVLRPGAGPGWALLGLCKYETRDYPSALEDIQRSLSIGVGGQEQMLLVLKFHEAALLTKMGRFDAALTKYADFTPAKVSDEQVLLGLGLAQLRRALTPAEIPPAQKDFFLAAGRALAAFLAHDDNTAKAAYQELAARFPDDANVLAAYGYYLFGTDPDKGIAQWKRALTIDPDNALAHAMLSWAFWLREDNEAALRNAQAAIRKDPNSTIAQVVMGRLLVMSKRIDEGIEHLELAAHLEPANLEAHLALATAYSEAGRKLDSRRERQLCGKIQAEAGPVAQP